MAEARVVDGALHGPAPRVPEHHDEIHPRVLRVLQAAELVVVYDVCSHADREAVTEDLVEDDLGRDAREG